MHLLLLGTAAAEAWPAPFCACPSCEEARRRGGPNIRSRSGALLDDEVKIDFGPDTVTQLQPTRRNLSRLKTIIFTHQHTDHFVPSELEWLLDPFTKTPPAAPIEILANSAVLSEIQRASESLDIPRLPSALNFRETKP